MFFAALSSNLINVPGLVLKCPLYIESDFFRKFEHLKCHFRGFWGRKHYNNYKTNKCYFQCFLGYWAQTGLRKTTKNGSKLALFVPEISFLTNSSDLKGMANTIFGIFQEPY